MSLFSRQPEPAPIDRRRSLESIPALNPGVRLEREEDGRLLVIVPVSRPRRRWLARFQPRLSERRVRLDRLGAFVLERIDGARPVRAIVEDFVQRFGTTRREAELSTAEFLKALTRRNIISIGVQ